jgi:ABC-type phosphate transport system permease subunit
MMVAPGIITAPVMGVARVLGFTPAGIAASKSTPSTALSSSCYYLTLHTLTKILELQSQLRQEPNQLLATSLQRVPLPLCRAPQLEDMAQVCSPE